jgi:serine protease SohB
MQFLSHYGLFLAQTFTLVLAILLTIGGILVLIRHGKGSEKEKLEIKNLNKKYEQYADILNAEILQKSEYKKLLKEEKKEDKKNEKENRKRIFVLEFYGDIRASSVNSLREEITAIIRVAKESDEVVVCLDSPGGMVSPYGLAASELQRLRRNKIPLTVAIDKMAASGGYLMACVADKILAAPFAIIGSIGVVAQIPNFHRLLKSKDIDFEQLTAGEYKRTLTMFGENTPKARQKMQEDLEDIHHLFKEFIQQNRPQVNIEEIATGEHWLASRARDFKLVDELMTSDDYLLNASQTADVYQIRYTMKKSLGEKLSSMFGSLTQGRMI